MNKTLQHIKEHTEYVEADRMIGFTITLDKQISCVFKDSIDSSERLSPDNTYRGEVQRIYLDKQGVATGYDVYVY